MPKFKVPFVYEGEAEVTAENAEEAQDIVSDGLDWWDGDIDWDGARMIGTVIHEAEEV